MSATVMKKINGIKTFVSKQVRDIKLYGTKEIFRKFFIFTRIITRTLIDVIAVLPCIIILLLYLYTPVLCAHLIQLLLFECLLHKNWHVL